MLSFYRSICLCAIRAVRAICVACLDKSSPASPHTSLHTSGFLQVIFVVFFGDQEEMTTAC